MKYPAIIQIDDCLISSEIFTGFFACDYEKCRGCCCVIGDSGAPLEDCEVAAIERNYAVFSPLMSEKGRKTVSETGYSVVDADGDLVTPLVPGSEECVYTHFDENGNCFCSIEKKWCEGAGDFCKPISCRLYPIRVSELRGGVRALNLHRWEICKDAFIKGKKENIRIYQFLKDPIIHYFGEEFYEEMLAAAAMFDGTEQD